MSRNKIVSPGLKKFPGSDLSSDLKSRERRPDRQIEGKVHDNTKKPTGDITPRHPNRNVDKPRATNTGGYKN